MLGKVKSFPVTKVVLKWALALAAASSQHNRMRHFRMVESWWISTAYFKLQRVQCGEGTVSAVRRCRKVCLSPRPAQPGQIEVLPLGP